MRRKMNREQYEQYRRGLEAGRVLREREDRRTLGILREQYRALARYCLAEAYLVGVARGIGPQ